MMKPVFKLKAGDLIHPKRTINDQQIKNWKYASECDSVSGGLMSHAELTIVDLCHRHPEIWVKACMNSFSPPRHLKISGEELSWNFKLV